MTMISFFKFPFYTQAVDHAVNRVSKASDSVHNHDCRLGYTTAKLASLKALPSLHTKSNVSSSDSSTLSLYMSSWWVGMDGIGHAATFLWVTLGD